MTDPALQFERDYEFAPVIVWDALTDETLVSGWLAEASITARVGGNYDLQWLNRAGTPGTAGSILALQPLRLLEIATPTIGRLRFELEPLTGGSRGTSTRLRVLITVDIEPVFATRVKADWLTNLDQLEDLLHGHPVDWANWDRDRHESWTVHFAEVENPAG